MSGALDVDNRIGALAPSLRFLEGSSTMPDEPQPVRSELPLEVLDRIDRICDRFEAAWDRGERPRPEDELGAVEPRYRAPLLRDLLAAEMAARRRRGERPEPRDYRDRFPGDRDAVDSAFGAPTRRRSPAGTAPDARASVLIGLLGFQTGLIDQSALVEALRAWIADKSRPLSEILSSQGVLDDSRRTLLEALAAECLKQHGGDVARSLASIPAGVSTRERLAALADTDLDATMAHVGVGPTEAGAAEFHLADGYAVGSAAGGEQRFRVLRPHAKGGLGAVFVAMDTELHREVALKQILERHADDPVSRSRFLLEAEITGGLEHPGIVPVYGLGTYADGRPYYAMRFVRGDSLKEAIEHFHADESFGSDPGRRSLELSKLLRRFLDVCNAVEYAHSRGVLHRDIKPGNVIVGQHGETLVVDWGLAKATGQANAGAGERTLRPSLASGSAETLPGSALGTPSYMSPEQAEGRLDLLGPRSDVYSLGATLYCLLTGRPPFESDDIGEVIRGVRHGDFPAPRSLAPALDRALEAVCLKAMARDPADRYDSCRALAEDIERWLAGEPVTAWREPLSRRVRRWASRNRTAVTAAAVALAAVAIGLGVVAGVLDRTNQRLREANATTNQALDDARTAQAETRAALTQSEESRQQAQAVSAFLVGVFRSPDPSLDGRLVKVVDILDRAVRSLDRRFTGPPAIRGKLLEALGRTYKGLGLNDRAAGLHTQALAVLEAALGRDHDDTLASLNQLALALTEAGRLAEAIPHHQAILERAEAKLGPGHVNALGARNNLAMVYVKAGRMTDAIALLEESLRLNEARLGRDHPLTLHNRNNLANALQGVGRMSEALEMHEGTLKLREARLGIDHPDTLRSRANVAIALATTGRNSEAIALFQSAVKMQEDKLGPDHADTLNTREGMAEEYEVLGQWAEAEVHYRTAVAGYRRTAPADSPRLAAPLVALGRNLLMQSRWSEAEPILRECVAIGEKATPDDWVRFKAVSLLGGSLLGQGRYAEAEPMVVRGYEGMKAREARIPEAEKHHLHEAADRVIGLYEAWGRPGQAAAWRAKLGRADLPTDVFAGP
jgi:tetratricopeptide (TPR) repeat protein/tRNA A-37 threonylcarbamoyl transferase component Bud32